MTHKTSPVPATAEVATAPRRVTQKQIAQRLGVTQQLVALALGNSPKVAQTTRDKIHQVAHELGYNASRPARAMAAARHGKRVKNDIIALILEAMPDVASVALPYFMPLVDGVEIESAQRQLDLFLVRSKPDGLPWLIREGGVDGVILLGSHASASEITALGIPVVTLGASLPDTPAITPADAQGTGIATRHLLELGHTRIAYLGPQLDWPSARARFAGYQEALRAANLRLDAALCETTLHSVLQRDGMEGMARLLERASFTALVCHNDAVAIGAVEVARQRGLSVPDDLSVTGFDDTSTAWGFAPAITSVGFEGVAMGRAAVEMLLDGTTGATHREFAVQLRVHQTSAPPHRTEK